MPCTKAMLKFGGFKASLNFYNDKRRKSTKEINEIGSAVSISGAYRVKRDESFGYNYSDLQRKTTSSIVPIPTTETPPPPLRHVKSTSDLTKQKNLPPNLQQQYQEVSQDPRGPEQNEFRNNKNQDKKLDAQIRVDKQRLAEQKKLEKQRLDEQKKLEKQKLSEQKKQEKLASQEQAKQVKLTKEREKKEAQQAKKDRKQKRAAPQRPLANPLAQTSTSNLLSQNKTEFSTNTLDSSISKTSGPPPYSEILKPERKNKSTDNVIYSKPLDTDSWDMVTQHRQNINRPMNTTPTKHVKQTMMDLNYHVDRDEGRENSEA